MKHKKKLSRQKSQRSDIDIVIEDETSDIIAKETIKTERANENTDSEFEDSIQEDLNPRKAAAKAAKVRDPTFNSWHDLDFPNERVELPKNVFSDGPTPWSNFKGW